MHVFKNRVFVHFVCTQSNKYSEKCLILCFFLPRERVPPVLLSEKGHFFVAEGWWQRSFSGKFLNNLLNGQFYTIKAVADISGVQVRGFD